MCYAKPEYWLDDVGSSLRWSHCNISLTYGPADIAAFRRRAIQNGAGR